MFNCAELRSFRRGCMALRSREDRCQRNSFRHNICFRRWAGQFDIIIQFVLDSALCDGVWRREPITASVFERGFFEESGKKSLHPAFCGGASLHLSALHMNTVCCSFGSKKAIVRRTCERNCRVLIGSRKIFIGFPQDPAGFWAAAGCRNVMVISACVKDTMTVLMRFFQIINHCHRVLQLTCFWDVSQQTV